MSPREFNELTQLFSGEVFVSSKRKYDIGNSASFRKSNIAEAK